MTRLSSLLAAATAAGALALAAPALAKDKAPNDAYYGPTYDQEIVIIAPGVRSETTERSAIGADINTLTTSRVVYTGDLNLRYDADVDELHRRIQSTARQACNDIERASSGVMLDSDRECVRDATREAMAEANAMVYWARS